MKYFNDIGGFDTVVPRPFHGVATPRRYTRANLGRTGLSSRPGIKHRFSKGRSETTGREGKKIAVSTYPSCEAKVEVGTHPKLGQRFICGFCSTELEVAWLDPVELDWPLDDEDELEYEDEDYYDYYDEPHQEVEDW